MGKTIKITAGVILLCCSAFYLLGVCIGIADAPSSAAGSAESYLEAEWEDSEYMGETVQTEWGEELTADYGYEYYRLTFKIENLSSKAYYGVPASALSISGEEYDDVRWDVDYEAESVDYEKLFYRAVEPALPGKTSTKAVVYVQVLEGVDRIYAEYRHTWQEDDTVKLEIDL